MLMKVSDGAPRDEGEDGFRVEFGLEAACCAPRRLGDGRHLIQLQFVE